MVDLRCLEETEWGGLMVLWKNELNVSIRSYNVGHIDMVVGIISWGFIEVIGFYGNPKISKRFHSWYMLCRLIAGCSLPWPSFGDFNQIACWNDQFGGDRT